MFCQIKQRLLPAAWFNSNTLFVAWKFRTWFLQTVGWGLTVSTLVLMGDFNLPDISWNYNAAEGEQSWRFLEWGEDNTCLQSKSLQKQHKLTRSALSTKLMEYFVPSQDHSSVRGLQGPQNIPPRDPGLEHIGPLKQSKYFVVLQH